MEWHIIDISGISYQLSSYQIKYFADEKYVELDKSIHIYIYIEDNVTVEIKSEYLNTFGWSLMFSSKRLFNLFNSFHLKKLNHLRGLKYRGYDIYIVAIGNGERGIKWSTFVNSSSRNHESPDLSW